MLYLLIYSDIFIVKSFFSKSKNSKIFEILFLLEAI